MPAVSKKQYRFMEAAKHNPKFAKKVGIKPTVADEFVSNNTGDESYEKLPERFSKLKKKLKVK